MRMRTSNKGFTIIELMVSLVVAGILMGALVALSGSVRRSFGRSKDISTMQSNLRFAVNMLAQDFSRAAYMYSVDAVGDPHTYYEPDFTSWGTRAIQFSAGPPLAFTLLGNFVSSRDYRLEIMSSSTGCILCRNGRRWDAVMGCYVGGGDDYNFLRPFADGPSFDQAFCPGEWIRLDVGNGFYAYYKIGGTGSVAGCSFQLTGLVDHNGDGIDRDRIKGGTDVHPIWINPVTAVQYRLKNQGPVPPVNADRWALLREQMGCTTLQPVEVADFLLPADDPDAPGLEVNVYLDSAATTGIGQWQPEIDMSTPVNLIPGGGTVNWTRARAIGITLRGRTATEDPHFTLDSTMPAAQAKNFGFDLDGDPDNGLAHVRTEHTLIELRNMALSANPS